MICEKKLHTAFTDQSIHEDLVQKSGLRRILFDKSCLRCILFHMKSGLRRIFFIQDLLKAGCIWFEVSYCVYQFIGGENDSNSNTKWSLRHSLYQTVIKKVSNNKHFVKSNLLRYKSHNIISIPKQFIRNNVQQGECLTESLQFSSWRDQALRLQCLKRHDAVTTPLTRSEWILVH